MTFDEQIMSKDKYRSIVSSQIEAIVLIILQIFFTTCAVLKIEEYHSDIPQTFSHVTGLDQSRVCENI